jgi:hypothetical protein
MTKKKNLPYKVGDNCYFMSKYMTKPKLGVIKQVIESEEGLIYQIIDIVDQRFNIVDHNDCGDDAKILKLAKKKIKTKVKK